jgi:hypothetical protein
LLSVNSRVAFLARVGETVLPGNWGVNLTETSHTVPDADWVELFAVQPVIDWIEYSVEAGWMAMDLMVSAEGRVSVTVWVKEPPTAVEANVLFPIVGAVVTARAAEGDNAATSSAKPS